MDSYECIGKYNNFMEKFTLINKVRSRIKVFEAFEDLTFMSDISQ